MSENQDKDGNPVTDSQETYYDKSQNISDSQMLNESQDFALIVGDDSDETTKAQTQAQIENISDNQTDENTIVKDVVEAERQAVINANSTACAIGKEMKNILTQVDHSKKDDINDDIVDGTSKDKRGSDEDEIIQGTPPDVSSPSRKLLSGKRKGESIDEPVSKIQRTLSGRDALKLEKENLAARAAKDSLDYKLILSNASGEKKETQSVILCDNTEHFDKNVESDICATQNLSRNIIIEETQNIEDSEPMLSGSVSDDDNSHAKNKPEESLEKDKTSSDQCNSQLNLINNTPEDNENGNSQTREKIASKVSENVSEVTTNGKDKDTITDENKPDGVMDVEEINSEERKMTKIKESVKEKDNVGCTADKEFLNAILPSSDSASESTCEAGSSSSNKSRKSIEVIYDRKSTNEEKKRSAELVTIDEDGDEIVLDSSNVEGEKIVLDSSTEKVHLRFSTGSSNNSPQNTTVYKSCMDSKSNSESSYKSTAWNEACKRNDTIETADCQLTNGEEEENISGTTKTISSGSDQLVDDLIPHAIKSRASKSATNDSDIDERFNLSSKLSETIELVNVISDSEGDSLFVNDNVENKSQDKTSGSSNPSVATKINVHEDKIRFHIELKYLLHVDENTKEIVYKEITDVQCDPLAEISSARRNSDTSGCLADVSGNANKDTSPGSVLSNTQLFQLPMSRFSIVSTTSSSSSASSAASLAAKMYKDPHFPLPKGRAKHAKRPAIGGISEEKLNSSETFEKITQGWKNAHLITDTVLQFTNMAINSPEIFQHDNEPAKSEDKALSSTPEPGSTEEKLLSSTPEPVQDEKVTSQVATPKSTKDKKPLKRNRTKSLSTAKNSRKRNASPEVITTSQEDRLPLIKRKRENIEIINSDKLLKDTTAVSTPSKVRPGTPRLEALRNLTPQNLPIDELVGKVVFAKWSDNNYYPGEVTEKTKGKYRVKFYDGQSKLLIEEFIIPVPPFLREGLSVYATIKEDDYTSTGIILKSEDINSVINYTVEMDNGSKVKVQIKDIFLKPGQAQILKEEVDVETKSLPRTPQHLDKVSLDNLVDWKRRQPTTPISTPKSGKRSSPRASRITDSAPASGSGVPKVKRKVNEMSSSESESKTSDSNPSSMEDVDGVQPELVSMPAVQVSKGPSSRMKGRGRSKSKQTQDDAQLGPIPPVSSTIFKNMSFILTSTSSDIISRHHIDDSCSETGTENEEEWVKIPFIKDRVKTQLNNGGGTVYDSFKQIPLNEYKNTKLITNAPNLTAKSIQCLSVGIRCYNHTWVINSCTKNKVQPPSDYELPAGWSLEKKSWIESYNRINKQPFNGMIVAMPMLDNRNVASRSNEFWSRICKNAGAGVEIIADSETDISHATMILTDNRCPSWLVDKANKWQIPLVSTVWITQCIIAGQSLAPDSHPQYKHTFIPS